MSLVVIDIAVAGILLFGLIWGYYKGIVSQLGSLGGLIVAILFTGLLAPLIEILLNKFNVVESGISHKLAYLIAFLILFFLCYFIARLIKSTIKMLHLRWLDRILGGLFGVFKYMFILSILLNLYLLLCRELPSIPRIPDKAKLSEFVIKVAPAVIDRAKQDLL